MRDKHSQFARRVLDQNKNKIRDRLLTLQLSTVLGEAHADQAACHPSRSRPAPGFQAGRARRRAAAEARRRHAGDHVRRAGHRACRDPGRRAAAHAGDRPRQGGEPPAPQIFINPEIVGSRDDARSTRKAACRSRTIMPRWSGRRRSASSYLDRDGKQQEVEAEGCSRPACSMRSTISTACCSSTTSPS